MSGIIDGNFSYLAVDSCSEAGDVFQVAIMNTPELKELVNMYNRSCSHIDFTRLSGPLGTFMTCFLLPGNDFKSFRHTFIS